MRFSPPIGKLARASNALGGSLLIGELRGSWSLTISSNYIDDGEAKNVALSADENFQGLVNKSASNFWAWDVTNIAEVEVDTFSVTIGDDRAPFGSIACDKEGNRFVSVDRPDAIYRNTWLDLEEFQLKAPVGGTTVRFPKWKLITRNAAGERITLFEWAPG